MGQCFVPKTKHMRIGFIGMGIMGSRMAQNLIEAGHQVTVFNRTEEALEGFKEKGASIGRSVHETVIEKDIVFSMLSDPKAIEEVFLSDSGVLSIMDKDSIWVDCSTVNPSFSSRCAAEAERESVVYIGAPVAGSKPQAEAGDLMFFCGGPEESIEVIRPLLERMGKKILHLGVNTNSGSFQNAGE